MPTAWDLHPGFKSGRLTLLGRVRIKVGTPKKWRVECSCPLKTRLTVRQNYFTRDDPKKNCGLCPDLKSLQAKNKQEHGIWTMMHVRCKNPNHVAYKHYGGRGISVCERWEKFEHFFADIGKRPSKNHSIDRIDNDGNYEPGNVRWATSKEQRANQRKPGS